LLYFLLTGQGPFEASTSEESWDRARRCDLDQSALQNTKAPRGLKRICRKALAAEPRSRYPSAGALQRALRRDLLTRRIAPLVGAAAILLALLGTAWSFWPSSVRVSPDGPGRPIASRSTTQPQSGPSPVSPAVLRVLRFEIPHFPKFDANRFDSKRVGTLGVSSFTVHEDDEVTVRAELSEPAHSYLIAFRPDGTDELCDPDDEGTPPPRKSQPLYPALTKSDERYRLSEGAGLCAFALVVSRQPLPCYRDWKRRVGQPPWTARLPAEPGIIWRDDNQGLQPLLDYDPAGSRGKGAKARGSGEPAARLAIWLRGRPGVDLVTVEAFPIEPALGP
jgi:hypothetical protein